MSTKYGRGFAEDTSPQTIRQVLSRDTDHLFIIATMNLFIWVLHRMKGLFLPERNAIQTTNFSN